MNLKRFLLLSFALLRCCIRRAVLVLTKIAPRLALQLAHEPTIPDLSYG